MAKIDRFLKKAKEHFHDEEQALQTVLGTYGTTLTGEDFIRRGIFIATDQRLLFYAKRLTGFDLEAFPYANISSMEMSKSLMGYRIRFFASGNSVEMKWIQHGDVRAFVDTVKAQMAAVNSSNASSSEQPIDLVDQLGRLGELHAAGVLNDEEFSAKKAEILARL